MSNIDETYNNGLNKDNIETDNTMWMGYQWYQWTNDNNQSQPQECNKNLIL